MNMLKPDGILIVPYSETTEDMLFMKIYRGHEFIEQGFPVMYVPLLKSVIDK